MVPKQWAALRPKQRARSNMQNQTAGFSGRVHYERGTWSPQELEVKRMLEELSVMVAQCEYQEAIAYRRMEHLRRLRSQRLQSWSSSHNGAKSRAYNMYNKQLISAQRRSFFHRGMYAAFFANPVSAMSIANSILYLDIFDP